MDSIRTQEPTHSHLLTNKKDEKAFEIHCVVMIGQFYSCRVVVEKRENKRYGLDIAATGPSNRSSNHFHSLSLLGNNGRNVVGP